MYTCKDCGLGCSGFGKCVKCGSAVCFLCANFVKDGKAVDPLVSGGKPYCADDAVAAID